MDRLQREADQVMAYPNEEWVNRFGGDTQLFEIFDAMD